MTNPTAPAMTVYTAPWYTLTPVSVDPYAPAPLKNQSTIPSCVFNTVIDDVEATMALSGHYVLLATDQPFKTGCDMEGHDTTTGVNASRGTIVGELYGFGPASLGSINDPLQVANEPSAAYVAEAAHHKLATASYIPVPNGAAADITIGNALIHQVEAAIDSGHSVEMAMNLRTGYWQTKSESIDQQSIDNGFTMWQGSVVAGHMVRDVGYNASGVIAQSWWVKSDGTPFGDSQERVLVPWLDVLQDANTFIIQNGFDGVSFNCTHNQEQAAELYISMLGRAPDANGLNFWAGQLDGGAAFSGVADSIASIVYGGMSNGQVVTTFYQNALGRAPDAGGLAYWTGQLNSGMSKGVVVSNIINAVVNNTSTDAAAVASHNLFANKENASINYATIIHANDPTIAATLIGQITADPSSVWPAINHAHALLGF